MATRKREALHRPKRLTEEGIDRLKAPTSRQFENHYDSQVPGLLLRVNAGGSKAWLALYYRKSTDANGKRVSIATTHRLGRYPILKVKEAREAARKFLADPQKGLAQADDDSFEAVAQNFIKRHVDHNGLRSKREIVRCLDRYILPRWGQRKFTEITRKDVNDLLDVVVDDHGPVQADAVLAHVSSICNWYQSRNDAYTSPIVRRMRRTKQSERARDRILGEDEIRAVWQAASANGIFGALVQILLLTGQRLRKVAHMQWDDLSDDGTWTIRTEKREKGNPGILRLPPMALAIIAGLPRVAGNPFVFVGGRSGKPLSSFTDGKKALDRKVEVARARAGLPDLPRWTLHDLRRTARTLMAEIGVEDHIAERTLGHQLQGLMKVYNKHPYTNEKADALAKLAAQVERILNPPPPNVVPLAGRTR
jgi:integrase